MDSCRLFIQICSAICEAIEFRKERVIGLLPESLDKTMLNFAPLYIRVVQETATFFRDPCRAEASPRSVLGENPAVPDHGRKRAIERGAVQFEFFCNSNQRFSRAT